jgi:hypothetical protein
MIEPALALASTVVLHLPEYYLCILTVSEQAWSNPKFHKSHWKLAPQDLANQSYTYDRQVQPGQRCITLAPGNPGRAKDRNVI